MICSTSVINGKTGVFGLIGRSIEYTRSPIIHNELARLTGINSVYAAFPVKEPLYLEKALKGAHALGIKGLNVTVPYKKDIIPFLSGTDENAERIGAVNTLKYTENGYSGYNTDIYGVLKTFQKYEIDLINNSLLILGAGGGAAAVAFAAAQIGVNRIFIANRTNNNSEPLARRIKKYYNVEVNLISYVDIPLLEERCFIAQTTPVGMNGSLSPINGAYLSNSSGVFDIIYSPPKTKILADAEKMGKPFFNGLDMLVYQAVRAFEIWNGIEVGEELSAAIMQRLFELEEQL